jgi:hypothetical protein
MNPGVAALAVLRQRPVLGGVGHERAEVRLDAAEPAHAARRCGERAVAAGVEDHQPEPGHALQLAQHGVERDGFEVDVGRCRQRGVRRDQVVAPADLDAVAGEEDDAQLRAARLRRHLAQGGTEAVEGEVRPQQNLIEPELLLQRRGDGCGVVHRVGEPPDLVFGVADRQRHAPGFRGENSRHDAQHDGSESKDVPHLYASPRSIKSARSHYARPRRSGQAPALPSDGELARTTPTVLEGSLLRLAPKPCSEP